MPTSVINLAAGFVIRPVLTKLTDDWNLKNYQGFTAVLKKITAVIGALSVLAAALAWVLGRPVLRILEMILGDAYDGSLVGYHGPFVLIVLGGGFYAILNLYYYVLVILRRQNVIFGIYVVLTLLAAVVAPWMVEQAGIAGASYAYLTLMIVMAAGFVAGAAVCYKKEKEE